MEHARRDTGDRHTGYNAQGFSLFVWVCVCVRYFPSFFSIIPIQHWDTVSNPLKLDGAHPLRPSMREVTHVYIILPHILM